MFAILLIALCVVTAHGYYSPYFSCPPDSVAARQFQMLAGDLSPQEIPTVATGEQDLRWAGTEIQKLVGNSVSKALSYQKQFDLLIRPYVSQCCEKPNYDCASVNIPLRFIWYNYYYYHYFCFVIYPAGEQTIHYTKCTCLTCVRKCDCPTIGRCVEANYTYHYIIAYCPKLYYRYRYKILLVAVPTDCECMTYCPYSYYSYYRNRPTLGTAASAAAAQRAAAAQSAPTRESAEIADQGEEASAEGPPEGSSGSAEGDIPAV